MFKLCGVAALASVLMVPYAVAQDPRGTLRGTVTDPSGGSIPGVQVRAVNDATGVSASAETNAAGNYNMPFLLPGVYTFSVTVRDGDDRSASDEVTVSVFEEDPLVNV